MKGRLAVWTAAAALVVVASGLASVFVFVRVVPSRRIDAVEERLVRLEADVGPWRYTRAPLHGATRPGGGGLRASDWAFLNQGSEDIFEELQRYGQQGGLLTTRTAAFLDGVRPAVQSIYDSLRHGYVERTHTPGGDAVFKLGVTLLADARRAPPNECLLRTMDAIQVGHDLIVSDDPVVVNLGAQFSYSAQPVILDCASEANTAARRRSVTSLQRLSRSRGSMARAEAMTGLRIVRRAVNDARRRLDEDLLAAVHDDFALATRTMNQQLSAAGAAMGHSSRQFPDALVDRPRTLFDAMVFEALDVMSIRQLGVAICAYDDVDHTGRLPETPSCLPASGLADPFSAEPFVWERDADGRGATITSAGPPANFSIGGPMGDQLRIELPPAEAAEAHLEP